MTTVDPRGLSLSTLVQRQVDRTPDAIAITAPDAEWTYAQLGERAERVTAGLRARGVQPGELVGMAVERSAAAIAAILGILQAGCTYVPLDPDYPERRLRLMVDDCVPAMIVCAERAPAGLGNCPLVTVEELTAESAPPAPPVAPAEEDPAYLIYTSGSTGRPKGVVVPHRGIVNRILWEQVTYPTGPDDAILLRTPLSFDISLWEIFVPLSTGGRLVVADTLYRDDPRYLVELIRDEGITCIALVPSLLQVLLDEEPGLGGCPTLREVFCGGEALSPGLVRRFFTTVNAGLHNMYGPTEYSIDATYWDCHPDDVTVPIGYAIANTRLYVLDDTGRPVTGAEPGELHVAGLGLALGYLNNPELTRERFMPEPDGGGRMYRTGDVVRRCSDGSLEFLGRTDSQVKVRGFRVEPGEVERAILAVDGIDNVVVTAVGDGADAGLAAYVVPATAEVDRIRAAVSAVLPRHMVPSHILPLARLPVGPTGKLDKTALPRPGSDTAPTLAVGTGDEPSEVALVADVFGEVLGMRNVPPDGDFFDLGGNSLQAVRLLNRLRKRVDADIPLAALIEKPTVRGIAAAMVEARSA